MDPGPNYRGTTTVGAYKTYKAAKRAAKAYFFETLKLKRGQDYGDEFSDLEGYFYNAADAGGTPFDDNQRVYVESVQVQD
jgi:hypothetical protein